MKIILQEAVRKLGKVGHIVSVADGYARNFLLPQNIALRATKENIAFFEKEKKRFEELNEQRCLQAQKLQEQIEGFFVFLIRQAGESGQLYGSVATRDIAQVLSESGFPIERHQIVLGGAIKKLGYYMIPVELHVDIKATVHLIIAQSQEEALLEKQKILKESDPGRDAVEDSQESTETERSEVSS